MTTVATSLPIKEMKLNSTTCAFGTITQTLRSSRVQTKCNKHMLVSVLTEAACISKHIPWPFNFPHVCITVQRPVHSCCYWIIKDLDFNSLNLTKRKFMSCVGRIDDLTNWSQEQIACQLLYTVLHLAAYNLKGEDCLNAAVVIEF